MITYEIKHQPMLMTSEMEEHEEETEEKYVENEAEQLFAAVEEQETGESKESAETEELNKRCAEFIAKMRQRMKFESLPVHSELSSTKINATVSF